MSLLDFLFPKRCFVCKLGGVYICRNCLKMVKPAITKCPVCTKQSIDGFTHVRCIRRGRLDRHIGLWEFSGVIRHAVLELKFKFVEDLSKELAAYAVNKLKSHASISPRGRDFRRLDDRRRDNFVLVPIPLHKSRERKRGFNQSATVGKRIAKLMSWGYVPDLLVRDIDTHPQVGLKKKDRKENVRGVFSINPNYIIRSTNFILFDDVWTTGATMREAGKLLKRNGAKVVWAVTLAG